MREQVALLRGALEGILGAIEKAKAVGCLEHLDAWEDVYEDWHLPIKHARAVLVTIDYLTAPERSSCDPLCVVCKDKPRTADKAECDECNPFRGC